MINFFLDQLLTNAHTTSNQRRFHVDITLILRRQNDVISMVEKSTSFPHTFFQRNFDDQRIHVVSTYLFPCNFTGRKIFVVSTYFSRHNFAGRNTHFFSKQFCRYNFDIKKSTLFARTFFRQNFDAKKFDVGFG